MRIAILHQGYSGESPSGEDRVVENQILALRSRGHEVLRFGGDNSRLTSQNTRQKAALALGYALGKGFNPSKLINDYQPDVLLVHNLFPVIGETSLVNIDCPIISFLHNFRLTCAAGTLLRNEKFCDDCVTGSQISGFLNACYRSSRIATLPLVARNSTPIASRPQINLATRVVSLSDRSRRIAITAGVPREKIVTMPNFLFDMTHSNWASTGKEKRGWIFLGRLSSEKGLDALLKVWPRQERLSIAGDGPLRGLVENLKAPNITFLGRLSPSDALTALQRHEGHIFPSLMTENSPLSYIEALSQGVPTIALRDNSCGDEIESQGTGFTLKRFEEIPEAIQAVRKMGSTLRSHCKEVFIRRHSANSWLDSFENMVREW